MSSFLCVSLLCLGFYNGDEDSVGQETGEGRFEGIEGGVIAVEVVSLKWSGTRRIRLECCHTLSDVGR